MPPRHQAMSPYPTPTVKGVEVKKRWVPKELPNHPVPAPGEKYTGFLGDNFKDRPLLKRLNYLHITILFGVPLLAVYGFLNAPRQDWRTWVFTVFWYVCTGLGITAGYHRLFAHKSYSATAPLRWFLMFMGTGAVQGSIKWWCRDHRAHHRYVDTERDPYAVIKGFWHAHWGWMLVKQDPSKIGKVNISDLTADPMVRFQHKYYLPLVVLMGFIVPTIACGLLWGDYWGGFFFAGAARLVFVHHSTFCVNSLAHWVGSATYTDGHTARNHFITALATLGEGYHNFHHEFPSDYRNAIEFYQYDPTKIFIYVCSLLGLAYNLKYFPRNEIEKGRMQMTQKALNKQKGKLEQQGGMNGPPSVQAQYKELLKAEATLNKMKETINWGQDPDAMPVWTLEQFQKEVSKDRPLCILDGFVIDPTLSGWLPHHPGGVGIITSRAGKDISEDFHKHAPPTTDYKAENNDGKGYYKHSIAAQNLAVTMRIARIKDYWATKTD